MLQPEEKFLKVWAHRFLCFFITSAHHLLVLSFQKRLAGGARCQFNKLRGAPNFRKELTRCSKICG